MVTWVEIFFLCPSWFTCKFFLLLSSPCFFWEERNADLLHTSNMELHHFQFVSKIWSLCSTLYCKLHRMCQHDLCIEMGNSSYNIGFVLPIYAWSGTCNDAYNPKTRKMVDRGYTSFFSVSIFLSKEKCSMGEAGLEFIYVRFDILQNIHFCWLHSFWDTSNNVILSLFKY